MSPTPTQRRQVRRIMQISAQLNAARRALVDERAGLVGERATTQQRIRQVELATKRGGTSDMVAHTRKTLYELRERERELSVAIGELDARIAEAAPNCDLAGRLAERVLKFGGHDPNTGTAIVSGMHLTEGGA